MAHQGHAVHTHYAGANQNESETQTSFSFGRWLGKLAVMVIVLFLVSFFTPGFSIVGLWSFLIAAIVISLLDYLVESVMKIDASPFGKGLKGFLLTAVILYAAQFAVPNMNVTILGAVLGAVAIGILDALIPTRVM
ncbi:phage holin family protein [Caproicibacter sp.]|uniref:phage holin family protein n=1 Tax=Caproicibacter sp. TaxID=2814884 RepID=UPI003988DB75